MTDWKGKKTEHVEDIIQIPNSQGNVEVKVEGVPTTIVNTAGYENNFQVVGGLLDGKLFFSRMYQTSSWTYNIISHTNILARLLEAEKNKEKIIIGGIYEPQNKSIELKYFKDNNIEMELYYF